MTLVGLLVVLVLAGGTGLLVSLLHPQTTPPASAFHAAPCPFTPAAGVVQGKDVQCGYLTVRGHDIFTPQNPR